MAAALRNVGVEEGVRPAVDEVTFGQGCVSLVGVDFLSTRTRVTVVVLGSTLVDVAWPGWQILPILHRVFDLDAMRWTVLQD